MHSVVTRNNISIIGSGNETLFLAHGYGCDQHVWADIIPAFSTDYQIVTFDYVVACRSNLNAYDPERYSCMAMRKTFLKYATSLRLPGQYSLDFR